MPMTYKSLYVIEPPSYHTLVECPTLAYCPAGAR